MLTIFPDNKQITSDLVYKIPSHHTHDRNMYNNQVSDVKLPSVGLLTSGHQLIRYTDPEKKAKEKVAAYFLFPGQYLPDYPRYEHSHLNSK